MISHASFGTALAWETFMLVYKPRIPRKPLPEPYKVEVIADSLAPHGSRLTTFAFTYPRFVHAELMTHRVFSRNAASSRAIPAERFRELVQTTPALPVFWGANQKGMQAAEELSEEAKAEVQHIWLEARDSMVAAHWRLSAMGLHKQIVNRLLEPWMPITVLVTSAYWANFFHQRDHKDAQPELQAIATEAHWQLAERDPEPLLPGEWHMPFWQRSDWNDLFDLTRADYGDFDLSHADYDNEIRPEFRFPLRIATARCARVSYLNHAGKKSIADDLALWGKLVKVGKADDPQHFSPFEHCAQVGETADDKSASGNFAPGWRQYRKMIRVPTANEAGPEEAWAGDRGKLTWSALIRTREGFDESWLNGGSKDDDA